MKEHLVQDSLSYDITNARMGCFNQRMVELIAQNVVNLDRVCDSISYA